VFELARLARKSVGLSEIARPAMRQLADAVGETVLLTRRSGSAVVCLELEDAGHPVRISYERGHVLPINAGAAAEILLAWAPEEEVTELLAAEPLRRFTARTLTDKDQWRARLREIRANGYAISRGELDEGIMGIAAPVLQPDGTAAAAISVAAVRFRVPDSEVPRITEAVCAAADQISDRLRQIDS
jgi:DNA-binding IclR family transcriptional regulator